MIDREMEDSLQGLFLRIAHQLFMKNYHQMMALGIHPGQFPMLYLLQNQDGLTQREIARKLNVRPPTVTVTIRRLEKSGLVCRREDGEDRRVSRISLTAEGRAIAKQLREIMRRNEEQMFRGLSETERCLQERFFREILANVTEMNNRQEEETHD